MEPHTSAGVGHAGASGPRSSDGYTIGYVLKMFPRFSETFILNEILELERQGVDVRIYSLKKPDDGRFHADLAQLRAPVTYAPAGIPPSVARVRRLHGQAARTYGGRYWAQLRRALSRRDYRSLKRFHQAVFLAHRMQADGVDHMHAHFASSATSVAWRINALTGLTYSFTAHAKDIFRHTVSRHALERKFRGAAFSVTVSDYNVGHLSRLTGADRLTRIYNGLDLTLFSRNGHVPADPPLILGVGRLVEKKGFDDLVRACGVLAGRGLDFRCQIVGTGDQADRLAELIVEEGVADSVCLSGPLPRQALLDLIPRASVFAAPCVVGSDGNRDGLPTVLVEAMALKVPVVATPVTGIPELVKDGETGLVVPPRRPDQLADALEWVLRHPDDAERLATAGRRLVEASFDIRPNVAQLRALFESLPGTQTTSGPLGRHHQGRWHDAAPGRQPVDGQRP